MIDSRESTLIGQWIANGSRVVADEACVRIEALVANHLTQVAHSADGWSTLFQDPADGRLWERTFPQGDMHGGGPPALHCLSSEQARAAYGFEA